MSWENIEIYKCQKFQGKKSFRNHGADFMASVDRPHITQRTTFKGRLSCSDLAVGQLGLVCLQALIQQEMGNTFARGHKFPESKPVPRTLGRYHWWLEMEQSWRASVPLLGSCLCGVNYKFILFWACIRITIDPEIIQRTILNDHRRSFLQTKARCSF